jgi:hypothetical protein
MATGTPSTTSNEVTLPRGVWHLEGLVNLHLLPARGATVFVGAIPLADGSGAPARVIAVVLDPERKEAVPVHRMYRITTFVPVGCKNLDTCPETSSICRQDANFGTPQDQTPFRRRVEVTSAEPARRD